MPVLMLIAIVVVLVGIFFVATGRGGELAYEQADHAPLDLGPVSAADIALLRPPSAMWGYNMQVTDAALDQIARAMRERDVTIAYLQDQLANAQHSRAYTEPRGAHARSGSAQTVPDGLEIPGDRDPQELPGDRDSPGLPGTPEALQPLEPPAPAEDAQDHASSSALNSGEAPDLFWHQEDHDTPQDAGEPEDSDVQEDLAGPEPVDPREAAGPRAAEPAEPAEPAQPAESAEPAESPEPAQPAEPAFTSTATYRRQTPLVLKASGPRHSPAPDPHEATQPSPARDRTEPNAVLPPDIPEASHVQGPQGFFDTHGWWEEQKEAAQEERARRQAAGEEDGEAARPDGDPLAAEEQGW